MSLSILKGLVQLVILLITFECVTPVFASLEGGNNARVSFAIKKDSHSLLNTIAFEKAEEEQVEEQRDKFLPVEIADFTRIATLLAEVHSPRAHIASFEDKFDSHPALFKLYHVFLI